MLKKLDRTPKRRQESYNMVFNQGAMRPNTHCKKGWEIYSKDNGWSCSREKFKYKFRPEIDFNSKTPSPHKVFDLPNKLQKKKRKRKVRRV